MNTIGIKGLTVAAALLVATPTASAQEQADAKPVTFTEINDAVPDKFFDAASTAPDLADPNVLVIGFNRGRDPVIWKDREFKASQLAWSYQAATDTISFVITAPDGYFISSVAYEESIVFGIARQGRGFAATQLVVNGKATDEKFVDLASAAPTRVPMSITTSLVAANADTRVTAGRVIVGVEPLPGLPSPPEPETLVEIPGDILPPVASEEPPPEAMIEDVPALPPVVPLDVMVEELPGVPVELPTVPVDTPPPGGESTGY